MDGGGEKRVTAKRFLLRVKKHPESKYGAAFLTQRACSEPLSSLPNSESMLRTTEMFTFLWVNSLEWCYHLTRTVPNQEKPDPRA